MNITNPPRVPCPKSASGGFGPGLFGRHYKPIDSVLKKGILFLGERHFRAELYQIKLKIVVVFSSDDDRSQGKY